MKTKTTRRSAAVFLTLTLVLTLMPVMPAMAENPGATGTADTSWHDPGASEFVISTADQLKGLSDLVNQNPGNIDFYRKTVKLASDIDMSHETDWIPIGNVLLFAFSGTFDGGGHVISGLTINRPSDSNLGLFGYIDNGAAVKNLGLTDVHISGNLYIGGITGHLINSGQITGSFVDGTVEGNAYAGGLIGYGPALIENSYATGPVKGDASDIGGLAGYSSASIIDCIALNKSVSCNLIRHFLGGNNYGELRVTAGGRVRGRAYAIGRPERVNEGRLIGNYAWDNMPVTTKGWTEGSVPVTGVGSGSFDDEHGKNVSSEYIRSGNVWHDANFSAEVWDIEQ